MVIAALNNIDILSLINNGCVTIHGEVEFIRVVNQLTLKKRVSLNDPGEFNCNHEKV